ncbi:MAG TPA: hypothetical protein VGM05_03800 [Planctomycetaceae bacterium]
MKIYSSELEVDCGPVSYSGWKNEAQVSPLRSSAAADNGDRPTVGMTGVQG